MKNAVFSNLIILKIVTILFFYYSLTITLLKTVFSINILQKKIQNDYKATIFYFVLFFSFILVLPILFIYIFINAKHQNQQIFNFILKNIFKVNFGNYKLGISLCILSIPLILLIQRKQDENIIKFYPFSKESLKNWKKFISLEILYLIFYYTAWEFIFRGFFQNALLVFLNNSLTENSFQYLFIDLTSSLNQFKFNMTNPFLFIIFISISIQTIISTLFHIGHPLTEIFAALFGGFIFGIISLFTGSILYTVFIHAFLGITTDLFIKLRK